MALAFPLTTVRLLSLGLFTSVTVQRALQHQQRAGLDSVAEAFWACRYSLGLCLLGALVELHRAMGRWAARGFRLGAGGTAGAGAEVFEFGAAGVAGGKEVVLITGGSSGIGHEVVNQLLCRVGSGVQLVVLDREQHGAHEGANVHHYQCDVSQRSQVVSTAARVVAEVGPPTVIINNAGRVRARSVLDSSEADIRGTFDVNCLSHYWMAQAFVPGMVERRKGHVITVASSTAYVTAPYGVSYAASKAAALTFHEGLTSELRHLHSAPEVQTSILCPGHVRTRMFDGFTPGLLPAWVAPSLETADVAREVVDTVLGGASRHVILPLYSTLLPLLRALPTWIYQIALYMAKDSLKEVAARQAQADPLGGGEVSAGAAVAGASKKKATRK